MIRTLIVDDEKYARKGMRALLSSEPDIEVVGEAASGESAVTKIHELAPDLVFLDIQIPEQNGFSVLETVGESHRPLIVFVTAYDEFAIRAFDVRALDYLLKPVAPERLRDSLHRAREVLDQHDRSTPSDRPQRFSIRTRDGYEIADERQVRWIEAQDYYCKIHVDRGGYLVRLSLKALEERLDPARFLRVHRSTIVNVDSVLALRRRDNGEFAVVLDDGTSRNVSREGRRRLQRTLKFLA